MIAQIEKDDKEHDPQFPYVANTMRLQLPGLSTQNALPRRAESIYLDWMIKNPFRYYKPWPKLIKFSVMMYFRFCAQSGHEPAIIWHKCGTITDRTPWKLAPILF